MYRTWTSETAQQDGGPVSRKRPKQPTIEDKSPGIVSKSIRIDQEIADRFRITTYSSTK